MLLEKNRIEHADGNVDLTLEARSGESFIIRDIFVYNPVTNYISVWLETTRVGYFRVGGELGNHLSFVRGGGVIDVAGGLPSITKQKTLLGLLRDRGLFEGYPVPSGSKITVTGAAQAGAYVAMLYDKYEEDDITADMPNGEKSNTRVWVNYGDSGAAITTAGDHVLDTPVNPAEFDDFPFGEDAPDNKNTEILGICASDFAPTENDGTNDIATKYLKLIRETDTMFDYDRNGLLMYVPGYHAALAADYVGEGISVVGNYSDRDGRLPMMFDPALLFIGGDRLTVQLNTVIEGTGSTISLLEQQVAFIIRTTRL